MGLSLVWKIPASLLYGIGVRIRNLLYDRHLLRSTQVEIPTICVGNLTVGGTGKTPHIEWLIRTLTPEYKIAVLSLGYKRRSKGFVAATEQSTVADIGDECMQLHRKFPRLPIAVCKDRVEGIRRLQQLYPDLQAVLLDDAMQYRRLQCGCNLLLTTADNLYTDDRMLPWGRLRDTRGSAGRANAVIVTKCPDKFSPIDRRHFIRHLNLPPYQQLFFSRMVYAPLPEATGQLPRTAPVLLLTGIARPDYLLEHLRQRFDNVRLLAFPDHHAFSEKELQDIAGQATRAAAVFTTEKDSARLENAPFKTHVIRMEAQPLDEEEMRQFIIKYLHSCIY